jgi:hypothetical protein
MMNAFDVSVGVFARGLANLKVVLTKAEAHAASRSTEPGLLLRAQLASDMYSLGVQVFWASEGAKLAVDRLCCARPSPAPTSARSRDDERSMVTVPNLPALWLAVQCSNKIARKRRRVSLVLQADHGPLGSRSVNASRRCSRAFACIRDAQDLEMPSTSAISLNASPGALEAAEIHPYGRAAAVSPKQSSRRDVPRR